MIKTAKHPSILLTCLVICIYAASGCKSAKKSTPTAVDHSTIVQPKVDHMGYSVTDFQYFNTKARIHSSMLPMPVNATIRCRKDSILWITITPGFGIEAARLRFTRDSATVIDKINNQYLTLSYESLAALTGYATGLAQLQKILLGDPFLELSDNTTWEFNADTAKAKFQNQSLALEQKFLRPTGKLVQLSMQTDLMELTLKNDDFKPVEQYVIPFSKFIWAMNFDEKDKTKPLSIKIEHSRFEFLNGPMEFPFEIPPGCKKMEIKM